MVQDHRRDGLFGDQSVGFGVPWPLLFSASPSLSQAKPTSTVSKPDAISDASKCRSLALWILPRPDDS